MLILEISLHLLWVLHFLEVVIVSTEGSVISQISDFRFTFYFYVYRLRRGVECLVTCHGAAVDWGKGM